MKYSKEHREAVREQLLRYDLSIESGYNVVYMMRDCYICDSVSSACYDCLVNAPFRSCITESRSILSTICNDAKILKKYMWCFIKRRGELEERIRKNDI